MTSTRKPHPTLSAADKARAAEVAEVEMATPEEAAEALEAAKSPAQKVAEALRLEAEALKAFGGPKAMLQARTNRRMAAEWEELEVGNALTGPTHPWSNQYMTSTEATIVPPSTTTDMEHDMNDRTTPPASRPPADRLRAAAAGCRKAAAALPEDMDAAAHHLNGFADGIEHALASLGQG